MATLQKNRFFATSQNCFVLGYVCKTVASKYIGSNIIGKRHDNESRHSDTVTFDVGSKTFCRLVFTSYVRCSVLVDKIS